MWYKEGAFYYFFILIEKVQIGQWYVQSYVYLKY